MSLIDKFTLNDVGDDELRKTVRQFIADGVITERDVVATAVAHELTGGNGNGGENGKRQRSAADRPTKSSGGGKASRRKVSRPATRRARQSRSGDASRVLQGKYIAAIRRVPKGKRNAFNVAATGSREASIAKIDKAYPVA